MKCLHIVLNPFTHDSRVLRACETALEVFDVVDVFALHADGLLLKETRGRIDLRRFRLRTKSWPKLLWIQLFKYMELFLRMIAAGIRLKPDVVHANDLNALPIGFVIARMCGARLIYDSHEYWADVEGYRNFPRFVLKSILFAEKYLARRAAHVLTVSPGIAEELKASFGCSHITVVRNLPYRWRADSSRWLLRERLQLDANAIVFIYQGGIAIDRGVGMLFDAFSQVTVPGIWLVFLGSGPAVDELQRRAMASSAGNIIFHPGVAPESLPLFTSDADVGVLPQLPVSRNSELALPNKLFEYIQGGLALVAADLPEIGRLVRDNEVGLTFEPGNIDSLATAIREIATTPRLRRNCREAARSLAGDLCWEKEKFELLNVYREVVALRDGRRSSPNSG
jgi:glycosyltransferase involved in cell wall biosynthesis